MSELSVVGNLDRHLDAIGTFTRLKEAYFRYYDTPFGLADPNLQAERRRLLDRDGGAYRLPLLELRPEYASSGNTLRESVAAAGAPAELAEFAACGLIPRGRPLYKHQEEALAAAHKPGANMAITAGTGSGKTESFLLPVLADLLDESRAWRGRPAPARSGWWHDSSASFLDQRAGESGRPQGIRALILYPMNALVDDQLTRLRRALDSDEARGWMDEHRGGHRFYFGRYTGATPVTGSPENTLAVGNLRDYLRVTEERQLRAQSLRLMQGLEDAPFFVPRLDGAEMRSRWDMQSAPPDLMITNYSMLNVMLLRDRDSHFFDTTRSWLDADPAHRFTLVVDELHMYRGTAGTEVAYLLRSLIHRLGLHSRPEQLRVLAASASLDPVRDGDYLQEFFGLPRSTFAFIEGKSTAIATGRPGSADDAAAIALATPVEAAQLARERNLTDQLRASFSLPDEGSKALTVAELAKRLFPTADYDQGRTALGQILRGISASPAEGDPRLRAHYFFRNIPGMWACSDPECPDKPSTPTIVPPPAPRRVGRLYAEPATRCSCGARVLELLYCQTCGDVMLGGFAPEGAAQKNVFNSLLLADIPDLAKLPDQIRVDRTAANYVIYWPRPTPSLVELDTETWAADQSRAKFQFRRSQLNPHTGELRNIGSDHTGWSFHAGSTKTRGGLHHPLETLSPFPTKCPSCGDNWEVKFGPKGPLPFNDPLRKRSPSRSMRTGFEKINQVLATELASDLEPSDRKLIVFTDSRQDAAKLSAGLGLRHYQDLLRLLINRRLVVNADSANDLHLARQQYQDGRKTAETSAAVTRLRERDIVALFALRDIWEDDASATPSVEVDLIRKLTRSATVTELGNQVAMDLLKLGMNPGGPAAALQQSKGQAGDGWSTLYDNWDGIPHPQPSNALSQSQQSLQSDIHQRLQEEVIGGLFSGVGRDFESLGLGWLALDDDDTGPGEGADTPTGYVRSALRILADQRRFVGFRDPRTDPTPRLRKLWTEIEKNGGPTQGDLEHMLAARAGDGVTGFVINPSRVVLRAPSGLAWVCSTCRRTHLTFGCGLCTKCMRPLPRTSAALKTEPDYYAWKAQDGSGVFRLHCAELTGQTDRLDAQSRQSRFQGVFLGGRKEQALPDGVDLLSVTTTMEAGVDIGALSVVILGNMPPSRFNYQQRVGRAGRRNTPVAIALTVCRGRSHDEYYFDRPDSITNEPTPKPYLALDRDEIYVRALNSMVMNTAFNDIANDLIQGEVEITNNVHGAYGLVSDWVSTIRPNLDEWLHQNEAAIVVCAAALGKFTPREQTASRYALLASAQLLRSIDTAVLGVGHTDLSQRLAERGVLPMYGFPTSVRYLHLNRPQKSYPWPPSGTIDRELAMAVSQFSPLSEVVRDGEVFPVVGIAAFEPAGRKVEPHPDPLGPSRTINTCRTCSYLDGNAPADDGRPGQCPRCGASHPAFQQMTMREPLGFRSGSPRDFDGNFTFNPRTISARAVTDLGSLRQVHKETYSFYSGPGQRYVINDNRGDLFGFQRTSDQWWGGYVSTSAVGQELVKSGVGDVTETAIGAVQPTDFLFLGPKYPVIESQGIRLNMAGPGTQPSGAKDPTDGRRAAWYSLAFLLRKVAAEKLDIQPLELAAGIYSGLAGTESALFAFLADTSENGAGFSTHLGRSEEFDDLLRRTREFLTSLETTPHVAECSGSCYRCLRDYVNMAFHALLDWRLARDLLEVLTAEILANNVEREITSAKQWVRGFGTRANLLSGLPAAAATFDYRGETVLLVVRHSLEASEHHLMAPRLILTSDNARAADSTIVGTVYVDPFTLDRDPKRPLEMWEHAGAADSLAPV